MPKKHAKPKDQPKVKAKRRSRRKTVAKRNPASKGVQAKFQALVQRSRERRAAASRNPIGFGLSDVTGLPIVRDFVGTVAPAIGAYAGTKILVNVASNFILPRVPFMPEKIGRSLLAATIGLGASWLVGKNETLRKYQEAITVGAGLAVVQTLVAAFLPGLSWIVGEGPSPLGHASINRGAPFGDYATEAAITAAAYPGPDMIKIDSPAMSVPGTSVAVIDDIKIGGAFDEVRDPEDEILYQGSLKRN